MLIHYAYINKDTYFRIVPMQKPKKHKKILFAKLNSGYLRNLSRQTSDRK